MYLINLPPPSEQILSLVKEVAYKEPTNNWSKERFSNLQPSYVNPVAGKFFINDRVNALMHEQYSRYFDDEFVSTIGIMHNITESPASYPPHSDKFRRVAINFMMELGGDNVKTILYDVIDDAPDSIGGTVYSHDRLTPIETTICEKDKWYMFNCRIAHSVENIITSRCMVTISFVDITYSKFIEKYNHIILGGNS